MPKIKTRDVVKGTIKKIDKAAIAADRMRSAYVQTKEKVEHAAHPEEHSAEEYASDRIEGGVDRITHEAVHQFDKQGRKGLAETKRNVSKAKDGIRQFKEKRAAESLKRQSVRASGNKTIKTVEQTEKTVKQSARSAGKKTVKTVGKGTTKAAQKSVKTTKTEKRLRRIAFSRLWQENRRCQCLSFGSVPTVPAESTAASLPKCPAQHSPFAALLPFFARTVPRHRRFACA